MKITAVGVQKGGVGKTMMAYNLAAILAETEKVLVIDIDPQCNLSNNIGLDVSQKNNFSSRDIFEDENVDPSLLVVEHPIEQLPNMDVMASNIFMFETELTVINKTGRERILLNYIEDNIEFFRKYDHIIIDTNPSMSILNQNAFLAADSIILIAEADDNSRIGIDLFIYLWRKIRKNLRKEDNVKALIINKGDLKTTATKDIWAYCQKDEALSSLLVPQLIRAKAVYAKAVSARLPLSLYNGPEVSYSDRISAKEGADEIRAAVQHLKERGVF